VCEQHSARCRYKGVPGLQALYRAFPDAKWYIMIGALCRRSSPLLAYYLTMHLLGC
jgi:hypothetical protein